MKKIKYSVQKFINNKKADGKAIINVLYATTDIATNGLLTTAKTLLADTYKNYQEAKFNNLILDVVANNVNQDELLSFVNSSSEKDREFLCNIVLKNIHADNRLTTFILAKLWVNKIINGKLNYYEASLLTNINSLTFEDFEIFYKTFPTAIQMELKNDFDKFEFETELDNIHYIASIDKFKNIGIIQDSQLFDGSSYQKDGLLKINFRRIEYSDIFFGYLKEYFESSN